MNKMSFSSLFGVGAKDDVDFAENGDRTASGFRHQLYNVPEEDEDLTEAFKIRIGLIKKEDGSSLAGVHEVEQMNEVEKDATLSKFTFKKFVETCYKSKLSSFSKEPIKEPLLNYVCSDSSEENVLSLSALVISHAIKQFCKDVTTTSNKKMSDDSKPSILAIVGNNLETLKKSGTGLKESKVKRNSNSMLKIFHSKHKGDDKKDPFDQLLETIPTSDLEVAQFIVAYGLLSKDLRDEIFCQLCNQVSSNPSDQSTSSGWILHVLCAGCFKPTSKLLRHYMSFLNDAVKASVDYAKQVLTLLHRVNSFGTRFQPPTSLEFLAVKSRKKIMLPVILADGSVQPVLTDSVTTASEMCHAVCKAANMKEPFGFAINISLAGKVSSLGNGLDHVMDAVAECEQVLKKESSAGKPGDNAGWHLTFGKELFTPWHDAEIDLKSSSLIYKQICRSVENGEFRFKSDEDLAKFLARRCFVEIGPNLSKENLRSNIKNLLPKAILNGNNFKENVWMDLIFSASEKMDLKGKRFTQLQVLCSIVEGAQRKWPLQFSALFEVTKLSGPPLSNNELVIAISSRGIFLLEKPFRVLQGLHYYEIVEVTCSKSVNDAGPCFSLTTIKGDCWTFESYNSETITKLLCTFLDGLRRRSKWAIAIEEFILKDHSKVITDDFHLQHGDVVELLDETKQTQLKENWMFGKSERIGKIGPFPFDSIYILPTSEKPPTTFLNLFSGMSRKDFSTLPRKRGAVVLGKSSLNKIPELKEHSAI